MKTVADIMSRSRSPHRPRFAALAASGPIEYSPTSGPDSDGDAGDGDDDDDVTVLQSSTGATAVMAPAECVVFEPVDWSFADEQWLWLLWFMVYITVPVCAVLYAAVRTASASAPPADAGSDSDESGCPSGCPGCCARCCGCGGPHLSEFSGHLNSDNTDTSSSHWAPSLDCDSEFEAAGTDDEPEPEDEPAQYPTECMVERISGNDGQWWR